jgi:hypothetical protein
MSQLPTVEAQKVMVGSLLWWSNYNLLWRWGRSTIELLLLLLLLRLLLLKVEQVLCVPGQRSHPDVEVRAIEVKHGRKALLPYGVLLIPNQEKCDRQCGSSGEAVLAQKGESDVRHHLNVGVGFAVDDGPRPCLHRVEGYRHANLAPIQGMDPGQSATVDRSVPVIPQTDECIV